MGDLLLSAELPGDYEKTGSLGAKFIWFWGCLGTEAPEVCDKESGRHKTGQAFVPPVTFISRLPTEEATEQKESSGSFTEKTCLAQGLTVSSWLDTLSSSWGQ